MSGTFPGEGLPAVVQCPSCRCYYDARKSCCTFCGHRSPVTTAPEAGSVRETGQGRRSLPEPFEYVPGKGVLATERRPSLFIRLVSEIRRTSFFFLLYAMTPFSSRIETLKKYFRLTMLLSMVVLLPYLFTRQWISGIAAGAVALYLLYRYYARLMRMTTIFWYLKPVPVFAWLTGFFVLLSILMFAVPLPPPVVLTRREQMQDLIVHGSILAAAIIGYFWTRPAKP